MGVVEGEDRETRGCRTGKMGAERGRGGTHSLIAQANPKPS
jgi:hypothetical protein